MKKKSSANLMVKIILDIIMLLLLLMLYQKRTISMSFHEVAGLVLFGLFVVHNVLNWRWIVAITKKLFQKSTSAKLRCSWIVNFLLLISMSGIILTGLMIAKTLPFRLSPWGNARAWHYFFAAVSIVLMGIHLGLHWPLIKGLASKITFVPKKLGVSVGVIFLVAAVAWGGFSFVTGSFARWISGPFMASSFPQGAFGDQMEAPDEMAKPGEGAPDMKEGMPPQEPDGQDMDQRDGNGPHDGSGKGFGNGQGEGALNMKEGMPPQGVRFSNILLVIITYGCEMVVFAALTAFFCGILGKRKIVVSDGDNGDYDKMNSSELP